MQQWPFMTTQSLLSYPIDCVGHDKRRVSLSQIKTTQLNAIHIYAIWCWNWNGTPTKTTNPFPLKEVPHRRVSSIGNFTITSSHMFVQFNNVMYRNVRSLGKSWCTMRERKLFCINHSILASLLILWPTDRILNFVLRTRCCIVLIYIKMTQSPPRLRN